MGFLFLNLSNAEEQFKFKITEIEIVENGNLIIGSKNGKAETNYGYEIIAENFVFNKLTNILNAVEAAAKELGKWEELEHQLDV